MSTFLQRLFVASTVMISAPAGAETLWDNWYTVTAKGSPQSYYHEKAEITGDRAKIQVNSWIREGNKTLGENLGATAKNTTLLEPLLYNFHKVDAVGQETNIDGSVIGNGKIFSVKVKKGTVAQKPLRAEMLPKLILSSFFPLWMHKNYKRISPVQPIEFMAIVEDQVEDQVPVVKGTAYEMNPDDFAKKHSARKILVEFNKIKNIWWITKTGDAIKIEIPALEKTVNKVDQKTAESFLSKL